MPSRTRQDLFVAIAVLIFFAGMLVWSQSIADVRGREFPALVSGFAVLLCLLDVAAHTDTAIGRAIAAILSGAADQSAGTAIDGAGRETIATLWIVGATALIIVAGFLIAIPVYVFGYMLLFAGRSVWQGAIAAVVTTAAIWIGFEQLLSYELYRGVFAPG